MVHAKGPTNFADRAANNRGQESEPSGRGEGGLLGMFGGWGLSREELLCAAPDMPTFTEGAPP